MVVLGILIVSAFSASSYDDARTPLHDLENDAIT